MKANSWNLSRAAGRAVGIAAALLLASVPFEMPGPWWLALGLVAVWFVSVEASYAMMSGSLHPLGPSVGIARGVAGGIPIVVALDYVLGSPRMPLAGIALWAVLAWIWLSVWERSISALSPRRRVLIVGTNIMAADLVMELEAHPELRFDMVGVVGTWVASDHLLGDLDDLPEILDTTRPDIVVVASDRDRPIVFQTLVRNADKGFSVIEASQFFEYALGRVPVRHLGESWFMSVLHLYRAAYPSIGKRIFDVVFAAATLLMTLPLVPLVIAMVKTSRGPLLHRQTRVGEHGKPFTIYKFRTMRVDAEKDGNAQWAKANDSRITAAGKIMRRTRLDELPQLWNVLRGDMSFVGPRPERPEFLEFLEMRVPNWSRRSFVKPGMTGWAQVRRGYTADASGATDKLSHDLWYLRHRSAFVDFVIVCMTISALLRRSEHQSAARARPVSTEADFEQSSPRQPRIATTAKAD